MIIFDFSLKINQEKVQVEFRTEFVQYYLVEGVNDHFFYLLELLGVVFILCYDFDYFFHFLTIEEQ